MLTALREHFLAEDRGAIGYLEYSTEAREELARKSRSFKCTECGYNCDAKRTEEPLQSDTPSTIQQPFNSSTILLIGLPFMLIIIAYVILYLVQ